MATITAADVKKLRDATGAGMMDCKKALTETDGDYDKAIEILRVSGQAKAAKRGAERSASNGLVAFDSRSASAPAGRRDRLRGQERRVPGTRRSRPSRPIAASQAELGRGRQRRHPAVRPDGRLRRSRPSRSRSARSSRSAPPRTSTARPSSTCTSGPPTCRRRSASWSSTRATTRPRPAARRCRSRR